MRILFLILLYISGFESTIVIEDAGLASVSRGDMALIFYVSVTNIGTCKYNIFAQMDKCCELFSRNDMDCHSMQLIGGHMGKLKPKASRNISLIYPTLYLHNRFGHCLISIYYNTEKETVNVEFNTHIHTYSSNMKDHNKGNILRCSTADLDPLDECEPVNCEMKYLGVRNYFSYRWNRCQKVPYCIANPHKLLPDVAYVPLCNACRDLENIISVSDIQVLQRGDVAEYWKTQIVQKSAPRNVRCHHGTFQKETGFCVCNKGWTSGNMYEPSTSVYHMCNTPDCSHKFKFWQIVFVSLIVGVCIAVLLLIISLLFFLIFQHAPCLEESLKVPRNCCYYGTATEQFQFKENCEDSITVICPCHNRPMPSTTPSSGVTGNYFKPPATIEVEAYNSENYTTLDPFSENSSDYETEETVMEEEEEEEEEIEISNISNFSNSSNVY